MAMPKKAKITSALLLLAVAAGCVIYLNRPESSASTQSTDDAYVQADFTLVAPQVSGMIGKVLVEENQPVKAGDLLAAIDDRDFIVAVDAAKAQVAAAQASVEGLAARVARSRRAPRTRTCCPPRWCSRCPRRWEYTPRGHPPAESP